MGKRDIKTVALPSAVHAEAVALNEYVVERWGEPPDHRPDGPGAAVRAGLAMLREVASGNQHLVPASHMEQYEELAQTAGLARTEQALYSIMLLAVAMGWARDRGANVPEAAGAEIVATTIRSTVDAEIMETEAVADPQTAEALRLIARRFLDHADNLEARARAVSEKLVH